MFDFDEIEETVQRDGDWKEGQQENDKDSLGEGGGMVASDEIKDKSMGPPATNVKKDSSAGGMFDFDEIEDDARTRTGRQVEDKSGNTSIAVDVAFNYKGQTWNHSFQVAKGSSVFELKQQMASDGPAEATWIQLLQFGRPLADTEVLSKAERLDFAFQLPTAAACERRSFSPEATLPQLSGCEGDFQVTIHIDRAAGISQSVTVKKGSTVSELKAVMARQDTSGVTKPDDFNLCVCGGSGRTLAGSVVLEDGGLCQLDLLPPILGIAQ